MKLLEHLGPVGPVGPVVPVGPLQPLGHFGILVPFIYLSIYSG